MKLSLRLDRSLAINWICFFVGMTIVWISTHSLLGLLGAWIASIHLQVRVHHVAN
jgi:hypothetical protein